MEIGREHIATMGIRYTITAREGVDAPILFCHQDGVMVYTTSRQAQTGIQALLRVGWNPIFPARGF